MGSLYIINVIIPIKATDFQRVERQGNVRYLLIVYCSCDKVDMMEDNGEKDREQSLNVQR